MTHHFLSPDNDAQSTSPLMHLRYGYNIGGGWRDFTCGPHSGQKRSLLEDTNAEILRVFLFEDTAPDPILNWNECASYLEAILHTRSLPMIDFVGYPQSSDAAAIREYAGMCGHVVQRAIDSWGGEAVAKWYWCLGDEPNSPWSDGSVPFDVYRCLYEEVAQGIHGLLAPHLAGGKALIGGPAIDTFRPFWFDWAWRFVHEIDNSLIGFIAWNRFGDWRERGAWRAPVEPRTFERLLLSRTSDYRFDAEAVARIVEGRDILNICSELNAHSHHEPSVSSPYNQSTFGAAYYGSALIQLMRGDADGELWWAAVDSSGSYAAIGSHANPFPAYWAKRLCATHVRFGDRLVFLLDGQSDSPLDIVIAIDSHAQRRAFISHLRDEQATYKVPGLEGSHATLKVDASTRDEPVCVPFDGSVSFEGYGVAAIGFGNHGERSLQ